jgi:AraC-like DNA-binding protein
VELLREFHIITPALRQIALLRSRLPMIEIALKCGFADRACFIRRFHELLNTTPGEWRKKREKSGAACNFPAGNGSNDR